jgi:hypothetical protein
MFENENKIMQLIEDKKIKGMCMTQSYDMNSEYFYFRMPPFDIQWPHQQ